MLELKHFDVSDADLLWEDVGVPLCRIQGAERDILGVRIWVDSVVVREGCSATATATVYLRQMLIGELLAQ